MRGMIIATMVMLLLLVLFPMLDCPDVKLSEEGIKAAIFRKFLK